jgi:hypothetical protein
MYEEKRQKVGLQSDVDVAIIKACTGYKQEAAVSLKRIGFNIHEIHRLLDDPWSRRFRINIFLVDNGCELK